MARMHTKKHGKSGSFKPMPKRATSAEGIDRKNIEQVIEGYAKQGMSPAMIGLHLKREHNVPYIKHAMNMRLVAILTQKKLNSAIPADMLDLMRKAVKLHKHLQKNKQDNHNRTSLKRTESKIMRLGKYYIREGKLPHSWRYNAAEAELIIKGR